MFAYALLVSLTPPPPTQPYIRTLVSLDAARLAVVSALCECLSDAVVNSGSGAEDEYDTTLYVHEYLTSVIRRCLF